MPSVWSVGRIVTDRSYWTEPIRRLEFSVMEIQLEIRQFGWNFEIGTVSYEFHLQASSFMCFQAAITIYRTTAFFTVRSIQRPSDCRLLPQMAS